MIRDVTILDFVGAVTIAVGVWLLLYILLLLWLESDRARRTGEKIRTRRFPDELQR